MTSPLVATHRSHADEHAVRTAFRRALNDGNPMKAHGVLREHTPLSSAFLDECVDLAVSARELPLLTWLMEQGADMVASRPPWNHTPLMRSVGFSWVEGSLFLLDAGVDVMVAGGRGRTVFHMAAQHLLPNSAYRPEQWALIERLTAAPEPWFSVRDTEGHTPADVLKECAEGEQLLARLRAREVKLKLDGALPKSRSAAAGAQRL